MTFRGSALGQAFLVALASLAVTRWAVGQPLPSTHVGPPPPPQGQAPNYDAVPPGGAAPRPSATAPRLPAVAPPLSSTPAAAAPFAPAPVLLPSPPPDGDLEPPRFAGASELDARLDLLMGGSSGLKSDDVAHLAYSSSSEGLVKRAEARAADARVDQAIIGYFPRLSVVGRYTRYSNINPPPVHGGLFIDPSISAGPVPPGTQLFMSAPQPFPVFNDQYLGQVNLTIPLSDYALRISQNYSAAAYSASARRFDERAARLQAAAEARLVYFAWVRAQALVVVSELGLAQARAHQNDVRIAVEAGRAAKADLMSVNAQVAQAELALERAGNETLRVQHELSTKIHKKLAAGLAPADDIRRPLPAMGEPGDLDGLERRALAERPEVRALEESARSYREQAKVARAAAWPRLEAFGDVIYANPNPRYFPQTDEFKTTWDVGVQLTWVANDAALAPSLGAEAASRAELAEAQRQELREAIAKEVHEAFYGEKEAVIAAGAASQQLEAAEEAYRVRRTRYRNGGVTSAELTGAELELFRARIDAVDAHADLYAARVRLLRASGRDAESFPN